ncbi:histone-lysine N-methyltransferase KMT5B-like [Trichogramma pretiosum]|uniref:histone-lysine N-methyltransferase KMT5B-like n=1 Tax=Trichogramma pretiosum TaxID=7493 RepID=UPI000C71B314|nr:histone-lysine N-methyltransferase KMT5B-like [Trichogramma pretiosum]
MVAPIGLQVVATCEIEEKTIIQGVFGIYKPLRNEHESTIAFINHHCKPNCEYVSSNPSYVKLRSLKKIQKGEELFVYYGDNYFDSDNKNCECSFCKPIDTIKISNEAPNNELDTNLEVLNDELDSSQKASHDEFNSTLETINDELDSTQNASYDQLNSTLEADFFGFENSTTNEDISFQSELYLYKEKNKRRTTDSIQTDKILKVILPKISLEDYKKSMTDNYKNDTPKQKRPFCPFCKKFKSRFSDHIQSVHSNEKDVQKLMKCKDKKLRSAILSNLRSKGYGMYFEITGTMIPVKKPKKNASNVEKVQCPTCQGHYSKSTIWKHKKIHLYYRT